MTDDSTKEILTQWNKECSLEPYGVIVGCSCSQEWLLPWWWMHFQMHNSEYPVTFFDFGDMTQLGKNWCSKRGRLETLPKNSIGRFIAPRQNIPSRHVVFWESHKNLNVWEARVSWFQKPFACLHSPYKKTLWIDLDCQVRKSIAPLFVFCDTPYEVAMVEEPAYIMKLHRDVGELLEQEIEYNAGVIAFNHGANLIQSWARKCLECNQTLRGDQEVFSRLLFEKGIKILPIPPSYVERSSYSPITLVISQVGESNIIVHWAGSHKQLIRISIELFKTSALMDFSL